jgi:hypothetical protein
VPMIAGNYQGRGHGFLGGIGVGGSPKAHHRREFLCFYLFKLQISHDTLSLY